MILDTSFLLFLVESGRDVISIIEDKLGEPVHPLVPDLVLGELRRLAGQAGRLSGKARMALEIAAKMEELKTGETGQVDEKLVELSLRLGNPVVTVDSGLEKHLRKMGVKCIYVNRRLEVYVLT
ncbi:MAG: hypothetical protein QW555_04660 [Nitrososphaerota archaeon]